VLDLLAVLTAALTALLVARLTRLLVPDRRAPREVLVSVAERGTAPRSRWPLRPRRSATA
jgi:hypothetical protein